MRRHYGNHFIDYLDPFARRRTADMALQLKLGLLSERRIGSFARRNSCFSIDAGNLSRPMDDCDFEQDETHGRLLISHAGTPRDGRWRG